MNTHRVQLDLEEMKKARSLLEKAQRVLIISHRNPDADSVGSNSALRMGLVQLGKSVESACFDDVPASLHFIKHAVDFKRVINIEDYDVVMTVDCGASQQVKFQEIIPGFLTLRPLINIDHHATNDFFGSVNIVDPEACATAIILYYFFEFIGVTLTPDIATSLITALYYDTGSFKHSNTTSETYKVMAALMKAGGVIDTAVHELFKNASVNKLKLWGRALARARLNSKGILISVITARDFKELDLDPSELSGVIDYLNMLPTSKFCILLSEDLKGNIKGSCRTQSDDVDLSILTSIFGGGGHKLAAGFSISGTLDDVVATA